MLHTELKDRMGTWRWRETESENEEPTLLVFLNLDPRICLELSRFGGVERSRFLNIRYLKEKALTKS